MRVWSILLVLLLAFSTIYSHDLSLHPNPYDCPDEVTHTSHWAMQLDADADPKLIAKMHGHEYLGPSPTLKGVHLFKKLNTTIHGITHPHHETSDQIRWAEKQLARQRAKRISIGDPLFPAQWHLRPESPINVNAESVWQSGITGKGVVIGVVDDGLEYTHPDLSDNYRRDASYDFNNDDADPFPDTSSDDHGTSAAGVAGARDNSVCGIGSAFRAGLSGLRLISRPSTDYQESNALTYKWNINDIYTNSWGPIDDGRRKEGPGRLASLALANGVKEGRNGKGSIFVWAGGNGLRSGDNCNYDGWANSRFTIAIGAVDKTGTQAWYSESCAMLVVSAPSSGGSAAITTTDLRGARGTNSGDCTSTFGGTSAAAPLAAGIVALILEANANLGWRDVQAVLIDSAVKVDLGSEEWVNNGAGFHVNHKYGFGLINAAGAVAAAKQHVNFPPEKMVTVVTAANLPLPDYTEVSSSVEVSSNFTVEHVEVTFRAQHRRRGDLQIILVSPSGTSSVLAAVHGDINVDYNWTFGTIRCWGEKSSGSWQIKVYDGKASITGVLTSWELKIYGH